MLVVQNSLVRTKALHALLRKSNEIRGELGMLRLRLNKRDRNSVFYIKKCINHLMSNTVLCTCSHYTVATFYAPRSVRRKDHNT
jgi:hypothetical protein